MGLLLKDGECLCSACVEENKEIVLADTQDGYGNWCAVAAYYVDADDDLPEQETACVHCARSITDATTRKS